MSRDLLINPPAIETRTDSMASTSIDASIAENPAAQQPLYSCAESSKLLYFRSARQADIALSKITTGPLGFDMEWRPVREKNAPLNPVALVQLATDKIVYLIQVSAMKEFPQKLRDILQSPNIIKTGVGIQSDILKLYGDYGVSTRACVDLSLFARSVDNQRWKGHYADAISLARLVNAYTEQILMKTSRIRRSDWQAILSPQQMAYAANDAHAGLTVYNHLCVLLAHTTPVPKASCYSFDCIHGHLCHPTGAFWYPYNPDYISSLPSSQPPERLQVTDSEPTALHEHPFRNDSTARHLLQQQSAEGQDLLTLNSEELPR